MQNRFGFKDFVLLVLVLLVVLLAIMGIGNTDRVLDKTKENAGRVQSIESQVGRLDNALNKLSEQISAIQEKIDAGVKVQGSAVSAVSSGNGSVTDDSSVRDASWAHPGVEIKWQPPYAFKHNPADIPNADPQGQLTEIFGAQTKTLTPVISTDVYSSRVQSLIQESLADFDPETLKFTGVLADAWQIDPDGRWLRAHIRKGVRFSDGTPVTAEDFRFTFHDYIMNPEIEAERTRSTLSDSIDRVVVIDDRTVEFVFKNKLFTNTSNALGFSVLPKHIYSKFTPAQINGSTGLLFGSGPFRLAKSSLENQWAPPADIILERNEQYWGPKPMVAVYRFQAITEEIASLNSFYKGDAEIISPASSQFVAKQNNPEWTNIANFYKWYNMRSGYSFIGWNCGERDGRLTPFHDKYVRRAMTLALDRQKLIDDISKGIGQVAKGNMPISSPGANKDIKPWPYDPVEAKKLLANAGWIDRDNDGILEDAHGNKFTFKFVYPGGSEIADRLANFIKDSYKNVGIQMIASSVDWTVFQDILKTRDFDAVTLAWSANSPESDPRQIFHSDSIKNQGDNFAQWNCPEADKLIDAGRLELDDAKRAKIWQQLEAVFHEEQPYTFLRVSPSLRIIRKSVGNVHTYPKGFEPVEFVRLKQAVPTPPAN